MAKKPSQADWLLKKAAEEQERLNNKNNFVFNIVFSCKVISACRFVKSVVILVWQT